MKKIGLLCLVLIFALGSLGIGYAHWSDTVDIYGHVDTGTVEIGIRDAGTNDGPGTADPMCGDWVNTDNKDVACTTSTNVDYKCWHAGHGNFYQRVNYRMTNVYPGYAPAVKTEICNCGTIPVNLNWGPGPTATANSTNGQFIGSCFVVEAWEVWDNGVSQDSGHDWASLNTLLEGYQLDPCHKLHIFFQICFLQDCWIGGELPQGEWVEFSITVTGVQWNYVPGT